MKLTITGIVYLDGCIPFVGIAIDETGGKLDVIFSDEQRVTLLDTVEMTSEMIVSPHHSGRPAFAIHSMKIVKRETVGSLRRLKCNAKERAIS
jgi:hypothetical protein